MIYSISGYNLISDELVESFVIPENMTQRILEIIGSDYDGANDYRLTDLTLDLVSYALAKYGFKINFDLDYSIGTIT